MLLFEAVAALLAFLKRTDVEPTALLFDPRSKTSNPEDQSPAPLYLHDAKMNPRYVKALRPPLLEPYAHGVSAHTHTQKNLSLLRAEKSRFDWNVEELSERPASSHRLGLSIGRQTRAETGRDARLICLIPGLRFRQIKAEP